MVWKTTREELQNMNLQEYTKAYNVIPDYSYTDNWYSNGPHWHRSTFFMKYIKPEHRVLDCGCSDGGLSLFLATEIKCQIVAQDISSIFVGNARKNTQHLPNVTECIACCIENLPLASESFDIVVAGEVLEHVLNIEDAIKESLRVLKPNGYLLATTPRHPDANPQHLRYIDTQEWNRVLSGCTIEDNQHSWLVAYKK